VKQRIAVLTVFFFLFSIAAAPAAWGSWPLWPQEGVPAGTVGPTQVPTAEGGPATGIKAIEIEAEFIEGDAQPTDGAAVADASQAGVAGGEKVAAGFFSGSTGKWAAFGAAVIAIAVIVAGAGSSTAHH
jgi:hypothetical protein